MTPTWTIKLNGSLVNDVTGPFEFGLTVSGRAKLWVDGKLVIDNWTKQRPGDFFYGQGTIEEKAIVNLTSGKSVKIYVEYTNTTPPAEEGGKKDLSQPALMRGVRLGGALSIDPDAALEAAVKLAKESDVAVVVVGLTSEWEAEGSDRPTLDLPARQHELIHRVAEANPKTVVIVQAGSATSMPYLPSVAAIVQAWYSGNEVGNAIADVLFGSFNPSGKLPITLPHRIEDIGPAAYSIRSENGKIYYREDLFVGYKHYDRAGNKPMFPFGFGLSYTTFSISDLVIDTPSSYYAPSFSIQVRATVTNTGPVVGSHVVQLYISLPETSLLTHPSNQLRAFAKVRNIAPGTTFNVKLTLNKYAFSYWDDRRSEWVAEKGEYGISVGSSSADLPLRGTLELTKGFTWAGL